MDREISCRLILFGATSKATSLLNRCETVSPDAQEPNRICKLYTLIWTFTRMSMETFSYYFFVYFKKNLNESKLVSNSCTILNDPKLICGVRSREVKLKNTQGSLRLNELPIQRSSSGSDTITKRALLEAPTQLNSSFHFSSLSSSQTTLLI